ncbi:MAG: metalloregulator ArsR/SmtB family transcription factor [Rhodospirillaceae bacterium]|nr:metalloregulator ArsR/SmtB family transcription factor [Rhodospirillaceae bacterium]
MEKTLEILRAVAEPTRLRLLAILSQGELTVSELVRVMGQSQPRLSRHLRILSDAGLLERLREGSWVFYRPATSNGAEGASRAKAILDLLPIDDAQVAMDRERLNEIKAARVQSAQQYFQKHAGEWDRLRALNVDEDAVTQACAQLLPMADAQDLLDIGTGTGKMLEQFAPDVQNAWGIDLNAEMLQVARANLDEAALSNVTLRQADLASLPFDDASFDAITCHQVLHFLDRPQTAVTEAARVLRPGGHLLVADLSPHNVEEMREQHAHRRLGFTDSEVKQWFADAGLKAQAIVHLKGDPLGVTLWLGARQKNEIQNPQGKPV